MNDRHDIVLREATRPGQNPPGLIAELRDLVLELFPDTAESGVRWLRGKSEQEIAKAAETRASALEKLGRLELERQKLLQERDSALRDDLNEQDRDRMAHAKAMYEQRTQRLKVVVEALKTLKEMGVKLNARTSKQVGDLLIGSLREEG
jgi:hypothetical protein